MKSLLVLVSVAAATTAPSLVACKSKAPPENVEPRDPPPAPSAPEVVPPAAPFNATPVAAFADAGDIDGQPPLARARVYEASGQLWMARLVLEPKALGDGATKEETELLAKICQEQGDAQCLATCGQKLGRKIALDAGVRVASGDAGATGPLHQEPDTDLARARDLLLRMQYEPARKMLEPKVLDGKASREEIRMLRTVCERQNDRMCIALCDAKLK